ncbi:hypothetical protein FDP41_002462 [Naegleria fowleri]|uniref:Uncharacterized protein n=1 Tax=Naegleria fowleri TaxID=5763 RepID=A0A6A5BVI6_NAEFO|nr:uncharacterized protein FDP41_002462 [Naegleria fowleri]KAF0978642.1 hypothetical protein FDP41_002462 [Naegleria fowleri]CAG4711517.1 unnamed protein product [Naegleria fowleri]
MVLLRLKSLTCFKGDVQCDERGSKDQKSTTTCTTTTKEVISTLTHNSQKTSNNTLHGVISGTTKEIFSGHELTRKNDPTAQDGSSSSNQDETSLLELLQSIAHDSSSSTIDPKSNFTKNSTTSEDKNSLSLNLLNHNKEERLLNSELPLPKNKHGQEVSAQLFWTSLPPGNKFKKLNRKDNKRRVNEKNWEKIMPRTLMDAATLLYTYPQVVDQIKGTKEYGLALDWLSEFESYGTCHRLESHLSSFPNCGYIEQFIVNVVELGNAPFKIILEIWMREEIIAPSEENPKLFYINSGQLLEAQNVYSLKDPQGDEVDEKFIPTSSRNVEQLDASQLTLENYVHATKDVLREFLRNRMGSISNKIINHLKLIDLLRTSKKILECERDNISLEMDVLRNELAEIALQNKDATLSNSNKKKTVELTLKNYTQATSNSSRSFIRSQMGTISNDILNHLVKEELHQIIEKLLKGKETHDSLMSEMITLSDNNKERKAKSRNKNDKKTKGRKKKENDSDDEEESKKSKRKKNEDSNEKQTKKRK